MGDDGVKFKKIGIELVRLELRFSYHFSVLMNDVK